LYGGYLAEHAHLLDNFEEHLSNKLGEHEHLPDAEHAHLLDEQHFASLELLVTAPGLLELFSEHTHSPP
jgi:hypothetical protein